MKCVEGWKYFPAEGRAPGNRKSARRRVLIARSPFDNSGNYPECSASIAPVPKKINPFPLNYRLISVTFLCWVTVTCKLFIYVYKQLRQTGHQKPAYCKDRHEYTIIMRKKTSDNGGRFPRQLCGSFSLPGRVLSGKSRLPSSSAAVSSSPR